METRLSNIFKTTNVMKFFQQSFYRILQVKSKWKTVKQPFYFLKGVGFWPTFGIQFDITLAVFREKLQNHTFQKAYRSLSKHPNIHINRTTSPLKIWKICFVLTAPFSNKKIAEIWKFQWIKYLGKGLLYLKNEV